MLQVKIKEKTNLVTFLCPECKHEDIVYTSQPKFCYMCGARYGFYVSRMLMFSAERRYYHFHNHEDSLPNGMLLK